MNKKLISKSILLGEKFATYKAWINGGVYIAKMEDYPVPGRENSRAYYEYLAFRIGKQIGLLIPHTSLYQDPYYGRLSIQQYIDGTTKPEHSFIKEKVTSSPGIRIALFDILCGNHDRTIHNLLQLGTRIIPIDFNVAFQKMNSDCSFDEEIEMMLNRWFQIQGILSLRPVHQSLLLKETSQIIKQVDNTFLDRCFADIPTPFCDLEEALLVRNFLIFRRDKLQSLVSKWWANNIAPLHAFNENAFRIAINDYL